MKELSFVALMFTSLLSGCGGDSAAGSRDAVGIDCAIEVQIAVVDGLKPGDKITDGDWRIAAASVLPVYSTGGPGDVVSNKDGTIVRIRWSDVRLIDDGVVFDGFTWGIDNRIDRRDGVSHTMKANGPNKQFFGTDFQWLISGELDTALRQQSGRRFVVRGRLLPKAPPVQPLNLEESAGLSS